MTRCSLCPVALLFEACRVIANCLQNISGYASTKTTTGWDGVCFPDPPIHHYLTCSVCIVSTDVNDFTVSVSHSRSCFRLTAVWLRSQIVDVMGLIFTVALVVCMYI